MVDPVTPGANTADAPRPPLRWCRPRTPGARVRRRSSDPRHRRRDEAEPLVTEAHIDDLLGTAVGRIALFVLQAQRPQEIQVEGERTIDVAHARKWTGSALA